LLLTTKNTNSGVPLPYSMPVSVPKKRLIHIEGHKTGQSGILIHTPPYEAYCIEIQVKTADFSSKSKGPKLWVDCGRMSRGSCPECPILTAEAPALRGLYINIHPYLLCSCSKRLDINFPGWDPGVCGTRTRTTTRATST
jgi:hypothetical protein